MPIVWEEKFCEQRQRYADFAHHMCFITIFREIEACSLLITSLCSGFEQVLKVKAKCERGSLIPAGKHYAIELFNMSACVDQSPFYGRCIGFHVRYDFFFKKNLIVFKFIS